MTRDPLGMDQSNEYVMIRDQPAEDRVSSTTPDDGKYLQINL